MASEQVLHTEIMTFWLQAPAFNELMAKNLHSKSVHSGTREFIGKLHGLKGKFRKLD